MVGTVALIWLGGIGWRRDAVSETFASDCQEDMNECNQDDDRIYFAPIEDETG